MSTIAYLLLGLVGALSALQLWGHWRARRLQGQSAPEFSDLVPPHQAGAPRLLFYFYGERCGPCRAMAPLVDRLARDDPRVVKVDVAAQRELARRFGVMGTPTFVLVDQGRIARVILGAATEPVLRGLLTGAIDNP